MAEHYVVQAVGKLLEISEEMESENLSTATETLFKPGPNGWVTPLVQTLSEMSTTAEQRQSCAALEKSLFQMCNAAESKNIEGMRTAYSSIYSSLYNWAAKTELEGTVHKMLI
uniref:Maintenance of Photosystem II under High light 2 C-terminal domain-containing protein n=2 Tax=Lotharella globosa TaxID=91324 RepID=A0A6V3IDP1_9EUKA